MVSGQVGAEFLWVRQFGTAADDHGSAVAVDPSGIYVTGPTRGAMPPAAGSLLRLFGSSVGVAASDAGMAIAGVNAVIWPPDRSDPGSALGVGYLGRQGGSMASGTRSASRSGRNPGGSFPLRDAFSTERAPSPYP